MTSTVKLRKPRNVLGSGATPSGPVIRNRPKSWTEFHTRFQAVSAPIVNIDISPVKMKEETTEKRSPNNYRKIRPLSTSILDQADPRDVGSSPTSDKPTSPTYRSFMVPNPWRTNSFDPKNVKTILKSTDQAEAKKESVSNPPGQLANYEVTVNNYDVTSEARNLFSDENSENNAPQAETTDENIDSSALKIQVPHSGAFSDTDSVDSAVAVSDGSIVTSQYGTSSERSPRWRSDKSERSRLSNDLDSISTLSDKFRDETTEKQELDEKQEPSENNRQGFSATEKGEYPREVNNLTIAAPVIRISDSEKAGNMNDYGFSSDEEQGSPSRFDQKLELEAEEYDNGINKNFVPSPLKSCYAPVASYEIPNNQYAEYSGDSSGEEDAALEPSRNDTKFEVGIHGRGPADEYSMKLPSPMPRPRSGQLSINNDRPQETSEVRHHENEDVIRKSSDGFGKSINSGTWPRRKQKKDGINPDEMMRKFQQTKELHLTRFRNIYADSRKRVDDVLLGLKIIMAKNGYSRTR